MLRSGAPPFSPAAFTLRAGQCLATDRRRFDGGVSGKPPRRTTSDLLAGEAAVFIVEYDEAMTSGDAVAAAIMATGAGARALQELPFVGALATATQLQTIAATPCVVRITRDEELEYHGGGAAAMGAILAMLERSVPTIKGEEARAPHVTGVVALMQERSGGRLTPDDVKKILKQSADPMDEFQPHEVGAGMLNALKAVARSRR